MFWDILSQYGLIISLIMMVVSLIISANCKLTFSRYSKKMASNGLTGAEAAQRILSAYGVNDVTIQHISGNLTDNYNPKDKTLNLSDSVYASSSIAAIGVAAHECGHAIQDATEYLPLAIQRHFAPICALGSQAGFYVVLAGLLFGLDQVVNLGIVLFTMGVFITVLLLPIEFDASSRALKILEGRQILSGEELKGARKVLTAAGLTYVAAAAASILSLLRLLLIARSNRRD